jgi:OOP family OmpA-OmpF porin
MGTKRINLLLFLLIGIFLSTQAQELSNSIYFKPGKMTIDKSSYDELYDIADIMQALPDYEFIIAGHVDSANSLESGITISKMRADAVKKFLVKAGVNPDQLETVGYGATRPKYNNQTPGGRSKNRRVEITLKGDAEALDEVEDIEDVDADFNLKEIAKEYKIPLKLLVEWNEIRGKLSFLEGKKDQLNKNIHFRSGSTIIRSSSKPLLIKIADFMLKYPFTSFTIGGHTDSLGSEEYNKQVSLGRADAVKDFLVKAGVNPKRLKTVGYGYTKPKFMNKNTWGKTQLNRRVEIVFDALNDYKQKKEKKIEDAMFNSDEIRKAISDLQIPGKKKIYHKVLKKQTLYSISQMYDVRIQDIRKWNRIKGNTIYTGKRLVIFVDKNRKY